MARRLRIHTRVQVEAVMLVTEKGYSVAEAARSLGIGQTLTTRFVPSRSCRGEDAGPRHCRRAAQSPDRLAPESKTR